jgi:hypothetical protein
MLFCKTTKIVVCLTDCLEEGKTPSENFHDLGKVVHACNLRYLGGRDGEDHGSRTAHANN